MFLGCVATGFCVGAVGSCDFQSRADRVVFIYLSQCSAEPGISRNQHGLELVEVVVVVRGVESNTRHSHVDHHQNITH